MVNLHHRRLNERKFEHWTDLPNGHRQYWYDVSGRSGWRARYIKLVNADEQTLQFYQEIYDDRGLFGRAA